MPVRTTLRQDGSSRLTPQGPGSSLASGASSRPERKGPNFSSFMARFRGAPGKVSQVSAGAETETRQATKLRAEARQRASLERSLEGEREDETKIREAKLEEEGDEFLDPLCRALASGLEWKGQSASIAQAAELISEPTAAAARVSLEQVLDHLVRRIAWSGNARAGAMRIELGAGALAGATLLVQADGPDVRVRLELPPGADAASWRERLDRRLAARGLKVTELDVQ